MSPESLLLQHVTDILHHNYHVRPNQYILLVYDLNSSLSCLLTTVYQTAIASFAHASINFDETAELELLDTFSKLPEHSVVILVQSLSFRVTKYRLRADLFRLGHQVIEHARLSYNKDEEIENYINSLKYDTPYYVKTCDAIEQLLITHSHIKIESGGNVLTIDSPFEKAIKNTGDFTGNPTASSGFPIGEVFTEAKQLNAMNGTLVVFGFPTVGHLTHFAQPFTVTIKDGCLVSHTGPDEFEKILQLIRAEEHMGAVQVREIGFGLNQALGFNHHITEPTSFERFCGMHFSLGLKHTMYRRKISRKILQKYHVDIFCLVERVFIGDVLIFEKGKYLV